MPKPTTETWLNVIADTGLSPNQIQIVGGAGVRVSKEHVAVSIVATNVPLTLAADYRPVSAPTMIASSNPYVITSVGTTPWQTVGATGPALGETFTATGTDSGTGVATTYAAVQFASIVSGNTYMVTSLGSSTWPAVGATAALGNVFVATANGSGATTGVATLYNPVTSGSLATSTVYAIASLGTTGWQNVGAAVPYAFGTTFTGAGTALSGSGVASPLSFTVQTSPFAATYGTNSGLQYTGASGSNWYIVDNGGCVAEGAVGYPGVATVGNSPPSTTFTLTHSLGAINGGCSAGTTITIAPALSHTQGGAWFDGGKYRMNVVGGNADASTVWPIALGNNAYFTDLNMSRWFGPTEGAILVRNIYSHDSAQCAFCAVDNVVSSMAENQSDAYITTANCPAGNCTTAAYSPLPLASPLPARTKVGFVLDISGIGPCHAANASIVAYSVSPPTITLNSPWTCATAGSSGAQYSDGSHPDGYDPIGFGNDFVVANMTLGYNFNGIEYFFQGGPYYDIALVNSVLNEPAVSEPAISWSSYQVNSYIANSYFNGPVSADPLHWSPYDVYFVNDTFVSNPIASTTRGTMYLYNDQCLAGAMLGTGNYSFLGSNVWSGTPTTAGPGC